MAINIIKRDLEQTKFLNQWINEKTNGSNVVLELGAGFFDRLQHVNGGVTKRIGIEIWQPYIDNAKFNGCIKIKGDVFDYDKLVDRSDFDTVMIIDVLEHFNKDDAFKLLDRLKSDFNKILLMIPEGSHPQETDVTGFGAHEYQKHRSTWSRYEFESLFDEVLVDENFHEQEGKDSGCIFATWIK
jgi:hypothetical protein